MPSGFIGKMIDALTSALRLCLSYCGKGMGQKRIVSPEELRELIEVYRRALRDNPQDCAAHYRLGDVYFQLNQFAEAMPFLQGALQIDPDYVEAMFLLGRIHMHHGRDDEAMGFLLKVVERNYESDAARRLLGTVYTNRGIALLRRDQRYDAVLREFKEALKHDPKCGAALLETARVFLIMGRYKEALAKLKEALEVDEHQRVEACILFGEIYDKLGEGEKSLRYYRDALKYEPRSARCHFRLGSMLAKLKVYDKAVEPLQTAIRINPRLSSEAYFMLGVSLSKLNRFAEAVAPLKEALKHHNNEVARELLAEAYHRLSLPLGQQQRLKEQIKTLLDAVDACPLHGKSYLALARVYDENKDGINAVIYATKASFACEKKKDKAGEADAVRLLSGLYKKYNLNPRDFTNIKLPQAT